MTREELLALGLTDEQAGAVLEGFAALAAQAALLEEQLAAAEQIRAENANLAGQLAQLQAQLTLRDRRDAVLAALPQHKPRDPQLVADLIDLEHIEDGALEEQIAALKKRAPYLFADAPDPAGGTAASGMNAPEFDMNAFLRGDN